MESLCDELVAEILVRLPAKTLFKSKCVCKRWRNLSSNQFFITNFISRSKSLPPLTTAFFYNNSIIKQVNFFDFNNTEIINYNEFLVDPTLSFLHKPCINVLASHNGILLCFSNIPTECSSGGRRHYFVCNPVTKQWVDLPELDGEFETETYRDAFPLFMCYSKCDSFDHQIEFKIVYFGNGRHNEIEVDTFCSETRERKRSTLSHNLGTFEVIDHYQLSDETAYLWSGHRLCGFDINQQTFRSLELPANDYLHICFSVSAGSLYFAGSTLMDFKVWVLVDGVEWSLEHCVEYVDLNLRNFFGAFAFHPIRSELVLVRALSMEERRFKAFSYCTQTGIMEFIYAQDPKDRFGKVFPYVLPAWLPCL